MPWRKLRRNNSADFNESDVAIVNEKYTADCMSYQFVVNPDQRQYHVEGQRQAVSTMETLVSAPLAAPSFPPKPNGKPNERPDDNDHPCVQKSSANEVVANVPIHQNAQNDRTREGSGPVTATGIGKCNETFQDALDKAIEESKATKDLVCP